MMIAFAYPAITTHEIANPTHAVPCNIASECQNQNNDGNLTNPAKGDPKPSVTRAINKSSGKSPCDPISGMICVAAEKNAAA
jgi:hypothetical protein